MGRGEFIRPTEAAIEIAGTEALGGHPALALPHRRIAESFGRTSVSPVQYDGHSCLSQLLTREN